MIFLFILAEAITTQARGPILVSLERAFGVSEAALGLVAPAGTIGFLGAILVTGLLAGRISVQRTMVLGIAGVIGSLLLMAIAPHYLLFLVALLAQGSASGAFRGVDRVVLSHLYPDNRGRMYAAYTFVWAIGAVLGPQLVSGILTLADWRSVFVIIAICFLPAAVLARRHNLPSMDAERALSKNGLQILLRRPPVVCACISMVLVGALEGIMFTWLAYYAGGFYDTVTANLLLSIYLLAYLPARLVYMYVVDQVPYLLLLVLMMLPVAPALAVAFSGFIGIPLFTVVFIAGAGISGGFPLLSAYAVEAAPEYSGPLNALTNGSLYVGMSTAPAAVGLLAEVYGIRKALSVTVCLTVALIISIVITWFWTGTADASTPNTMAE
ncbi:MFS transporter [Natronorubrum sp. FCH18a]|uniref:MFS transporter n=1 Tax=Natronorubrum sp. FCH18a TaxID=3447018 RepID=UPI003F516F7F